MSYLTNETSFSESGSKCFVLTIFITIYYLFDHECDKKGVCDANGTEWRKTKNEAAVSIWWYGQIIAWC